MNSTSTPRVSIVTPLFQKGAYLAETIAAVRGQTFGNWEMLIVDNGSTDEGPGIASEIAGKDSRVRLVLSERRGPGAARNTGLNLAMGEWVLFLDADDLLEAGYLAERLGAIEGSPAVDVISGPWQEFREGARGEVLRREPAGWHDAITEVQRTAIAYPPWPVHAALVRRRCLSEEVLWPEHLDRVQSEDTAFWFRLLVGARLGWAEGSGAVYRLGTASSRDAIRDVRLRFEAVRAAVEANVAFLESKGAQPTKRQQATLVRVFECEYQRARGAGLVEVESAALAEAERWLKRSGAAFAPGMWLRAILGVRTFNRWRKVSASP